MKPPTICRRENVISLPRRLPEYGNAHVPPSDYDAYIAGCETWARCRGWEPRVVILYRLVDPGVMGVVIPAYYRVRELIGCPRRNGRFRVGTRSRLYRDLARMMEVRPPTDRIPLDALTGVYRVVVRDTDTDQDQRPLGAARYSVIDWVRGPT